MVKPNKNVKIVKIPLEKPPVDYPQIFTKFPRLYLEIIENKSKIRQSLINREHDHSKNFSDDNLPTKHSNIPMSSSTETVLNDQKSIKKNKSKLEDDNESIVSDKSKTSYVSLSSKSLSSIDSDDLESRLKELKSKPKKSQKDYDTDSTDETRSEKSLILRDVKKSSKGKHTVKSKQKDKGKDNGKDNGKNNGKDNGKDKGKDKGKYKDQDDESIISSELNDLDSVSIVSSSYNSEKDASIDSRSDASTEINIPQTSKKPSIHVKSPTFTSHTNVPTLAELEKQGSYVPRNNVRELGIQDSIENQEQDIKRELLYKFDQMKKSYPTVNIPEYTIHSELRSMQMSYEDTKRRLAVDSSIEFWKTLLVLGFQVCELIMGKVFKLDAEGFFNQQMISMHRYNELLVELGEKNYTPGGSNWPVEIRLIGTIALNAVIFIVMKMIMKKGGANLMASLNSVFAPPSAPVKKRPMKPPSIDLDSL